VTPLLRTHEKKPPANGKAVADEGPYEEILKAGFELQFRSFTDKSIRGTPFNSCVIGPTASWKPSRSTRLDISPLFGVNRKSPEVQLFAVFSYLFGPGGTPRSRSTCLHPESLNKITTRIVRQLFPVAAAVLAHCGVQFLVREDHVAFADSQLTRKLGESKS
jgi:hypothetical protein